MDTPEVQKQNLDCLYQAWLESPPQKDDKAFDEFEQYVLTQNLTFTQVFRIINRNP